MHETHGQSYLRQHPCPLKHLQVYKECRQKMVRLKGEFSEAGPMEA